MGGTGATNPERMEYMKVRPGMRGALAGGSISMKVSKLYVAVPAVAIGLMMMTAIPPASGQSQDVLSAGAYTAKVKAIVCGGCGPLIKQTLEKMTQIDAVSVDSEKLSVNFTVKKDSSIKLSEIQKALKAAADKMGMGADYTLSDLKPLK